MMPLGDDNSGRKITPIITWGLILINFLFFFAELSGGEKFVMDWSFIPVNFLSNPAANFMTLFTSMFMHAGWGHLLGNMLYLWIFGDNVEDSFGHLKYLLFYILSGLAATFAQLMLNPSSDLPNLGASGAIAGVLGAYILLFPNGKVDVLLGRSVVPMSAIFVIGLWIVLQLVSGVGTLASSTEEGGVAYMAHIGGFFAGLAMAFLFHKFGSSSTKST